MSLRFRNHPGTAVLVAIVFLGAVAGSYREMLGAVIGAMVMLGIYGPLYLIGAIHHEGKS